MPSTTKKSANARTSTTKTKKRQPPRFARFSATKYGKPALVIAAFMLVGAVSTFFALAASTTYGLWSSSAVPKTITVNDSRNVELGVNFKSSVAGYATGVRFYKGPLNTGLHTGNLWDSKGTLLASVKFTNETSSGWQTATFAKPVSLAANVSYVVSYHAPNGHYSQNLNYFRQSHSRNKLTAPAGTTANPNGVYAVGDASGIFPNQGDRANYWVDINFTTKLINPQPAPSAPIVSATASTSSITVAWTASSSANPIADYIVYRDGNKIADTGTTVTFTDNNLTAGSTYSYQVQAVDSTGLTSALSTAVSATVPGSTGGGNTGGSGTGSGIGSDIGASACPLPKYPTPACTGVPAGTQLRDLPLNEDNSAFRIDDSTVAQYGDSKHVFYSYDKDTGATYITLSGVHVPGDLLVKTKNVIIKNSVVDKQITNDDGSSQYGPFTVMDTTIGPASGCKNYQGIGQSNYRAIRVQTRNIATGFQTSGVGKVLVKDSFAALCGTPPSETPPDGSHASGFQGCVDVTCQDVTIDHVTFDDRNLYHTAPVTIGLGAGIVSGPTTDKSFTLKDSLLIGGVYTIYVEWHKDANFTITGNQVVNNAWDYGPASEENTCSHQDWSGNKIVNIDANYNVTGVVKDLNCID